MEKIKNFFKNLGSSVKNFIKGGRSALAWKRGGYATILTVAVALAIVALNVLTTALAARFPLKTDITAQKVNSLSAENIDFIRNIDTDIYITVCAESSDAYASYVAYYAQYGYYGAYFYDATGAYFTQTPKLLQEYTQYNNKHIKVKYIDPSSVDFYEVKNRYPDMSFTYGDILVECIHKDEKGNSAIRHNLISAPDIYEKTDASQGYGSYYTVSGNMLESKLTTAINRVLQSKTDIIGYISIGCDNTGIEKIKSYLEDNNYELQKVDSLALIPAIPEEIDTLVISAPKQDFTAQEIEMLNTFLSNDGKLGKNIIFFPDASAGRLENLYNFLEDHGIKMGTGTVYETDDTRHVDHTLIQLNDAKSMFTENFQLNNRLLMSDKMVPLTIEANGENYHEIINTSSTCVVRPYGSSADWKPTDADVKQKYSAAVLSCQLVYDDNHDYILSNLVAFASTDFLTNEYAATSSVANVDMFINLLNGMHERDADNVTFLTKTVTTETFIPMENGVKAIRIIFMAVIPVLMVAAAVFVYIRRKSL